MNVRVSVEKRMLSVLINLY